MKNNSVPAQQSKESKRGGKRANAGRKKGVQNKVNGETKAKILKTTKVLPLEFLLQIQNEPEPKIREDENPLAFVARYQLWASQRLDAAKAAAPFVHPKLQAIEHSGPDGGPVQHKIEIEFVSPRGR